MEKKMRTIGETPLSEEEVRGLERELQDMLGLCDVDLPSF
jgi:hypothetical protein